LKHVLNVFGFKKFPAPNSTGDDLGREAMTTIRELRTLLMPTN
jgi:hypothetical protein